METHPRRVLVVDDDADMRECMTLLLNMDGHLVASVATGYDALTYLAYMTEPPALLLLDLELGDMTGEDVVAALRQRDDWSAIPVVLVSASRRLAQVAEKLGVASYLAKPFDPTALQAVVKQHDGLVPASLQPFERVARGYERGQDGR